MSKHTTLNSLGGGANPEQRDTDPLNNQESSFLFRCIRNLRKARAANSPNLIVEWRDEPLILDMLVQVQIPQSWSKKKRVAAMSGEIRPTKKPDFDNYAKTVDALNLIVWIDDAQIVDGRVRKVYSEQPGMFIEVRQMWTEGCFG
jgi:Holliday junction resolvase RusA-like endonuclease